MPNIQLPAKEMSGATVNFISLVERGANRIPFKIVKKEKAMKSLDLTNLGEHFVGKKELAPTVVGIATMKGENLEAVRKSVADAGFSVDDVIENEDGSVIFKQGDLEGGDTLVKLNDNVSLIMKSFRPFSMEMEESSLADMVKSQSVFPGVNVVLDAMRDVIFNTLFDAESPADAAAKMNGLFSEASVLIVKLMTDIPEIAFKLDKSTADLAPIAKLEVSDGGEDLLADTEAVDKAAKKPAKGEPGYVAEEDEKPKPAKKDEAEGTSEDTQKDEADDNEAEGAAKAEDGASGDADESTESDSTADTAIKAEDGEPIPVGVTKAEVEEMVTAIIGTGMTGLTTKMEELINAMKTEVTKSGKDSVAEVASKLEDLEARVVKAELDTAEATKAVKGSTVTGSSVEDLGLKVVNTRKRSGFSSTGEIDTAFDSSVRKKAKRG